MKKLFSLFAIVLLLGSVGACKKSESGSASDEQIKKYILAHPEVIVQSLEDYQRQQSEGDQKKAEEVIKTRGNDIFNNPNSPVAGNANAKDVIVEFFDYNCHYCKGITPDIKHLVDDNNVKIIFKELPILGPTSGTTALAALAVHDFAPDKYFAFYSALMSVNGAADDRSIVDAAKKAGIDPGVLAKKMADKKYQKVLSDNVSLAHDLGINGTPTFIINGKIMPGAMKYDNIRQALASK
jgi:protein-disulfide isomerase